MPFCLFRLFRHLLRYLEELYTGTMTLTSIILTIKNSQATDKRILFKHQLEHHCSYFFEIQHNMDYIRVQIPIIHSLE